jgi:hypothetical protein
MAILQVLEKASGTFSTTDRLLSWGAVPSTKGRPRVSSKRFD